MDFSPAAVKTAKRVNDTFNEFETEPQVLN